MTDDASSAERAAPRLCGCEWELADRKPAVINIGGAHWICRDCALTKHGHVGRQKVAIHDLGGDFSPANLKRLAAAGIMDANALFLPAGRISKAEADAREAALVDPQEHLARRGR